jgi:head-tail adaptor
VNPALQFIHRLQVYRGGQPHGQPVLGRVQPKSAAEVVPLAQGGVLVTDHSAKLLPTDVRSADRLGYAPDDGRRYTVLRVREYEAMGPVEFLDCDVRLVNYGQTVTVLQATRTRSPEGAELVTWTVPLPGHTNLPAVVGPSDQSFEQPRAVGLTVVRGEYVVTLDGHFPAITVDHRLLYQGKVLNIWLVSHDPLQATTTLQVRFMEPQ